MPGAWQKGAPKTGVDKTATRNMITHDHREMTLGALDELGGREYLVKQAEKESNRISLHSSLRCCPTTRAGDTSSPVVVKIVKFEPSAIMGEG